MRAGVEVEISAEVEVEAGAAVGIGAAVEVEIAGVLCKAEEGVVSYFFFLKFEKKPKFIHL